MQHKIDGIITTIVLAAIQTNIAAIIADVPFARARTPLERANTADIGPKRYAIMVIVYNVMVANPTIFPPSFNQANFTKSYVLIQVLDTIIASLESLLNLFEDTRKLVASDLYSNAMQAYDFEKSADKRGDAPIHASMVELLGLMTHATKDPTIVTIPALGSVIISEFDITRQVFVVGPSAVSVRDEAAPLSSAVTWNPLTSYPIPPTIKVMVITNLSATAATSISYIS
jgi:hypothetical protein